MTSTTVQSANCPRPQVESVEELNDEPQTPNLKVSISTKFPQAEIFGVKLINGHATQVVLDISNQEPEPVGVFIIGGSLMQDAAGQSQLLRNLTAARYQIEIPAGESESVTYSFSTEMHPQNVRLQLAAVLKDHKDAYYTVSAYNETVTVVEAPTSIFDPQMYALPRSPQRLLSRNGLLDQRSGVSHSLLHTAIL
jgi:hypothetical protein